ncbi:MAG TPA: hypothetical protein VJ732_14125, partial [Bryobacteraceae bacterium]|nr:hypothetical protein [Bryobacteraceae bacterium]
EDAQEIQLVRSSKSVRHAAQTVAFTEGDPIEEELREYVPKNPSPAVNQFRGQVSYEESILSDHAANIQTMQEGLVLRADMTRIGGTYWNFTGYWRGRLSSQSGAATLTTLNDLINRTYQIGFNYNNPNSRYVGGFGRFLLPWAPSLSTMDGAYFARRLGSAFTAGMFAGSTPDPTAWNYDPNRQMAGAFVAFEHGLYNGVRYTGTAGVAVTRSHWRPERQFLFFENNLLINTRFSLYYDLEADQLARELTPDGRNGPRLARSFVTLRYQPVRRLSIDLSHNYFRDVPTFDTRLLGTGLLDQFLFQGFSGGVRVEVARGASVYGNLGRSRGNQDAKAALNYSGGVTFNRFLTLPFRVDLRYSHFNSTFGNGAYESVTWSRDLGDKLRFSFEGGLQSLKSIYTNQDRSKYVNSSLDYLIGTHFILGAGWTLYRGGVQNYDQTFIDVGYRFSRTRPLLGEF